MATERTERTRMIVDLTSDVQTAIKLRAVKGNGTNTLSLCAIAMQLGNLEAVLTSPREPSFERFQGDAKSLSENQDCAPFRHVSATSRREAGEGPILVSLFLRRLPAEKAALIPAVS
jgi:hypothetical protein